MLCSLEKCLDYKTEQYLPLLVAKIFHKLYLQFLLWWVSSEFYMWIAYRSTWWKILSVEQDSAEKLKLIQTSRGKHSNTKPEPETCFNVATTVRQVNNEIAYLVVKPSKNKHFALGWEILPPDTNSRLSTGRNLNSIGVIWCMVKNRRKFNYFW